MFEHIYFISGFLPGHIQIYSKHFRCHAVSIYRGIFKPELCSKSAFTFHTYNAFSMYFHLNGIVKQLILLAVKNFQISVFLQESE